jgi:DNA-binding NarL/FixJ family response regulator
MNRYFVVESEQVVAEDLVQAIQSSDQMSIVETFRAEDCVLQALQGTRPKAVILSRDPFGFPETPLGRLLAEKAIPHAFLSTLTDAPGREAVVLASPFSDETVAAFLNSLPD